MKILNLEELFSLFCDIKMSQMIGGHNYLQSNSIITVPKKEVIIPKFKNLLHCQPNSRKRNSEIWSEEIQMMKLLKKLNDHEIQQIQKENNTIIEKKFQGLKRKMRKSAQDCSQQHKIQDFFSSDKKRMRSSFMCLSNNTEHVDLMKKYKTKIVNKMAMIEQTTDIMRRKKNYYKWLNSCKNSPTKSPNFTRMSFAIQRISQSKQKSDRIELLPSKLKGDGTKSFKDILKRNKREDSCYKPKRKTKLKSVNNEFYLL